MENGGMPEMYDFQDFLPVMADKLGGKDFMAELCNGFHLLADEATGKISMESLRRKASYLGLSNMDDDELCAMIKEGDLDGDGMLNEHEFYILMLRLSPSIMAEAEEWLEEALAEDLEDCMVEDPHLLASFLNL